MHSYSTRLKQNLLVLEILALIGFVALYLLIENGVTTWVLVLNLTVFYILFLRTLAVPDRILSWLPSYFTAELLFLTFSYLIFFYPYQMYLFGSTNLAASTYVSNSYVEGSNKAITLATIGMLAFTIGYRILHQPVYDSLKTDSSLVDENARPALTTSAYASALATNSSILLLALIAVYLIAGWRSAGEGRYTGTTAGGLGVEGISMAILMFCMVVAALWVHAIGNQLRKSPLFTIGMVVATAWILRLLVLGDRSSFVLYGLVLMGGYFIFVRRASLLLSISVFVVWLFVYNIVEVLRTIPNWYLAGNVWELLNNSQYYQRSSGESSFNITTITLRATVQTVPYAHDFTYGALKLIQFSTPVPFSGRLFLPYLNPDYITSADFLSKIMLGNRPTWSTGTNIISDSYLDFGVFGVVIVLFAVGLFAKAMRNYVVRNPQDPHRVMLYLLTVALFAELPRYAVELPIRLLAWALAFSAISHFVVTRFKLRATTASIAPTTRTRI